MCTVTAEHTGTKSLPRLHLDKNVTSATTIVAVQLPLTPSPSSRDYDSSLLFATES